jgi:hypothetical protein
MNSGLAGKSRRLPDEVEEDVVRVRAQIAISTSMHPRRKRRTPSVKACQPALAFIVVEIQRPSVRKYLAVF